MPRDYGCRGEPLRTYDANGVEVFTVGVQSDGTYGSVTRDSASHVLVRQGALGDGHYGTVTYDTRGVELTRTDERGIISPPLAVTMRGLVGAITSTPDQLSSTNGSFETLFTGEVPSFVHQGLRLRISYASDVGSTGEIRIVIGDFGTGTALATSNILSIGSGAGAAATLSWLHGVTLPGPRSFVQCQIHRTGGAGNVYMVRPSGCYFVGPDGMAGSGGSWSSA